MTRQLRSSTVAALAATAVVEHLETRLLLSDGVYPITSGSPSVEIAGFSIPSDSAAVGLRLNMLTRGATDYLRVSFGDGASSVQLGTISLAPGGANVQSIYIPVPVAFRGVSSTLRFELVSGGAAPTASAELSQLTTFGDLVGLNKDRTDALKAGAAAFNVLADELGRITEFGQKLPLLKNGRDAVAMSDLIGAPDVLKTFVGNAVGSYLSSTPTPTAAGLKAYLSALTPAGYSFHFDSLTATSTDSEVRFTMNLTVDRTTTGLTPDLGAAGEANGVKLDASAKVDAMASLKLDLAFGLKLTNGAALPGSFFLRLNRLGVDVAVNANGLNVGATVGLLSASVSGGAVTVSASALGTPPAALAGTDLSLAQIQSLTAPEALTIMTGGAYTIDLPIQAALSPTIAPLSARLTIKKPSLFSAAQPTVTATGFPALAKFRGFELSDVVDMFSKVDGWLKELGASNLLAPSTPFIQGMTVGDVLDYSGAFSSQVLSKVVDASGKPRFDSVSSLLTALGVSTTAVYTPSNGVLKIPISFTRTLPSLANQPLDLSAPLGPLGNATTSSKATITPTVSGEFILGIDFTALGASVNVTAATPLASLNGGRGIAPAGDSLKIEASLANGTTLTIALDGAVKLGDVASRINAAAPSKLKAAIDSSGKRLVLTDLTTGSGVFAVRKSGDSVAALGLGLLGQSASIVDGSQGIQGAPLHGDSIDNHVFIIPDSTSTPARLTGSLTATASKIAATASLGLVGVSITNGTATIGASASLPIKDGPKRDGRVTITELLGALADAATTGTLTGTAQFDLPVKVQPANFLPTAAGTTPTLSLAWTDPSLVIADGTASNGKPLSTNAKTVATYNAAASRLKSLAEVSYSSVEAGLKTLSQYFSGSGGLGALTTRIPLIDVNFGEFLGLDGRFDDFIANLSAEAPTSLADLSSKLTAAFNTPGASVKLSWDDSATAPALKFAFVFNTTRSEDQPINLSLGGGRTLFDVSQSANVQATATASATVHFGLDLTDPASPKPFLYDTTKLKLTAAVRSSAINFAATVGALGGYVHNSSTRAATATFDADGNPGGGPANFTISFPPVASGRYYFSGNVAGAAVETRVGVAKAVLPVFFPSPTTELGSPIEFSLNIANGATTLTTPFDAGMPPVDLGVNLDAFTNAFKDGMTKLKANLTRQLALFQIPLLGAKVTDSLSFIDQFRDAVVGQLQARSGSTLDLNAVKAAITAALGGGGLNWSSSSLKSASLLPDGTAEFKLTLRRAMTTEPGSFAFDLGLPGLGLSLNNAQVKFGASFDVALGFGLSKTNGFYLIVDPAADELRLTAAAEATALDAIGKLGLFQVRASKPKNESIYAGATFLVNLKDPSGNDNRVTIPDLTSAGIASLFKVGFGKDAQGRDSGVDVNIDVSAGFTNPSLPALKTGLSVNWIFAQPSTGANPLTGSPTIKFDDVSLQLGELFRNTIGPVLGNISKTIAPVKPIVDMLTARLPVISDLAGQNVSLADLATLFGRGDIADYVYAAKRISDLTSLISSAAATNGINLGGFDFKLPTNAPNLSGVKIGNILAPPTSPVNQASSAQKEFFAGGASHDNAGLVFPVLENPTTVFGLLLGQPVDLMQFDMPALNVDFSYKQFFPIIGPLGAQITGRIGASAKFGFGLDTTGFIGGARLLDGFYVKDLDSKGNDVPEVQFYGQLTAGAELNVAVASAGVEGGVFANVDFNLHDPNGDGKVRLSEIEESLALGPIFVFDVSGKLTAGLEAYAKIDLLFWSKEWRYRLATATLLDFNLARPTSSTVVFDPGKVDANGQLNLVTTANNDMYRILPGSKAGEIVIQTRGQQYTRSGVKTLRFLGQGGDDSIYVDPAVVLLSGGSMYFDGGAGNDVLSAGSVATTLLGGAGDDQLTAGSAAALLDGGAGNDVLIGGARNDTLIGGVGDDVLDGGGGNDRLDGGVGNDVLGGGDGNDTLIGGAGNDLLDAGEGLDSLDGGDGNDTLYGGSGANTLIGGAGNDVLDGGAGNDRLDGGAGNDTLGGGAGNDTLIGGAGHDLLFGDEGNDSLTATSGNDTLDGGGGNDVLVGGVVLNGGDGNDKLTGATSGNTTLIGGAGNDTITAGSGHDAIWGDDVAGGVAGDDLIVGGAGNDTIVGGGGANSIDAGAGDDLVYAGAMVADDPGALGNNTINGGAGHDVIYGGRGDDRIDAGEGNNYVQANAGNDTVTTGKGNDTIFGGAGDDSLTSGAGDDSIDGGDGADRIFAGLGNDIVDGGRGADLIIGGPDSGSNDNDTLIGGAGADTISGGAGNDVIVGDAGAPYLGDGGTKSGVDAYGADLISGGAGNDAIYGQGGNDTLYGNDGQDEIYGGIGNDKLYGGRDSDLLEGGDGADQLFGGTGADVLKLDTDAAYVTSGDSFDGYGGNGFLLNADGTTRADVNQDDSKTATDVLLVTGTAGNDEITIRTNASNAKRLDAVFKGGRTVTATWKDAANQPLVRQIQISGLAGNDRIDVSGLDVSGLAVAGGNQFVTGLFGGPGNDTLIGGDGRDQLYGEAGSDYLYGNGGDDRLWGDGLGGGDAPTDVNRLFGGADNDDLIGGQGVNHLYAWSSDPAPRSGKSKYGVFTDATMKAFEDTGLDRMLGGPRDDEFYGSGDVAFMYGNGGYDVIHDQAGAIASGQDTGLSDDQWKEQARKNSRVWYVPATDLQDKITVSLDASKQHVIEIIQFNNGAETLKKTIRIKDYASQWKALSTSVDQFRMDSVTTPGEYSAGAKSRPGLYQTAGGWGGSQAGPADIVNYDVILIDAFGGDDEIVVGAGVYKTVWVDGGPGNDKITINTNRIILPDLLEGIVDPQLNGSNNTAAKASNLGRVDASALLQNLTIHSGLKPADIDYYKFVLGATPSAGDALRITSLGGAADGMVIKLYESATQAVGSPMRTSSADGRLNLSGLVAGKMYWIRVASDGDRADQIGRATIYDLGFTLGGVDPETNVRDYSEERPVSNSNVLIGGAGNDTLTGGLGTDWIFGGAGDDILDGGDDHMAADLLFGEAGNDTFLLNPSTLPDGTTPSTFIDSDMMDGGGGYYTDVVLFKGAETKDFVAFGYNEAHRMYMLTQYVWDANQNYWRYDPDTYQLMQEYQFFRIARMSSIQFDLLAGDDEFHAPSYGWWMSDGYTYGLDASPTAPILGVVVNGGGGNDTIYGGAGDDSLYGDRISAGVFGSGFDYIVGGAGYDYIEGGDWNDTIYGGLGGDVIYGGSGNDYLVGDDGNEASGDSDWIYGGAGDDTIQGDGGNDYLYGEADNDSVRGGMGADFITGDDGDDTLVGDDGTAGGGSADTIDGGAGNDSIYGNGGGDYLYGGPGDDLINGNDGGDYILGEAGNDSISGNDGDDYLSGGADSDSIWGGLGRDTIWGGAGNDYLVGDVATDAGDADTINGEAGNDSIYGNGGNDSLDGGEGDDSINGNAGNDTVWGGAGRDSIWGGVGNDYLVGETGNDTIYGNGGSDTIYGGDGNDYLLGDDGTAAGDADTIWGGAGNDSLYGNGGNDYLAGEAGNDSINGNDGHDSIWGGLGRDSIWGGGGSDYLVGDDGSAYATGDADYIAGGDGHDSIWGNAGNDTVWGGTGNDYIVGEAGNDYMVGEAGNDSIWGGAGHDSIWGGDGSDQLMGDAGNDQLQGDGGVDSMWGGDGDDVLYGYDGLSDYMDGGAGTDRAPGYDKDVDRMVSIEQKGAAARDGAGSGGVNSTPLTLETLRPIVDAAIASWAAAGVSAEKIEMLRNVEFRIESMTGALLAAAGSGYIAIDDDAAGHGWFIDAALDFDPSASGSLAAGRMDLLTVVAHELGHMLGLDHDDDPSSVMRGETLAGERRLPIPSNLTTPTLAVVAEPEASDWWTPITPPRMIPAQPGVRTLLARRNVAVDGFAPVSRPVASPIKISTRVVVVDNERLATAVPEFAALDLALEDFAGVGLKAKRRAGILG